MQQSGLLAQVRWVDGLAVWYSRELFSNPFVESSGELSEKWEHEKRSVSRLW